jgi:hypothetical protein
VLGPTPGPVVIRVLVIAQLTQFRVGRTKTCSTRWHHIVLVYTDGYLGPHAVDSASRVSDDEALGLFGKPDAARCNLLMKDMRACGYKRTLKRTYVR